VLGSSGSAEFARDLEELFRGVCQPGRRVVMFELPLPPLYNEFGRIQRRLAAQYDVLLIPKRVLVDVIARDGATLDSIHLTERGHQRMAEVVWKIIESAYE
jgi:acyl-CoA thioesterase-1